MNISRYKEKFVSVVLILMLVLSMMPFSAFEAYAASVTTESTGYKRPELGYYVKTYYEKDGKWHWNFTNAITTGYLHKYIVNRSSGKNNWAYCIEPDKKIASSYDSIKEGTYWNAIPSSQREGIELAIKFGFQKNICNVPGYTGNNNAQYVATQMLIWEFKEGIRETPVSGKYSVYNSAGEMRIPYQTYYNAIKGKTPEKYYNKIVECIKTYYNGASFTKKTEKAAKNNVIPLSWNQDKQRWETQLTDSNKSGILATEIETALGSDFQVVRAAGSNQYTIYTKKAISGTKTISIKNYQSDLTKGRENEGRLVWVNDSTAHQPLITGSDAGVDLYMTFSTESVGTLSLKKTAKGMPDGTDIDLSAFSFEIKNDKTGDVITAKTDKEGNFEVNLPVGNYTVSENLDQKNLSKYWIQPESESVTVKQNKKATVTFTNQWKKGSIKILKTSSDGQVANISFKVTGPGGYEKVVKTAEDEKGTGEIVLTDLKVGVYKIEEIVPEGYFPQEPVEVDLRVKESEPVKIVKFHNIEFAGGIRIVKRDRSTGEMIKKEGFQFKIYDVEKQVYLKNPLNGDEVLTTMENGYTPYVEVIHGGKYVVSEVGGPLDSGYLTDAKDVTVTLTDEEVEASKTITVDMENTPQMGRIKVYKIGNRFASVNITDSLHLPVYEMKSLEGAVFTIKAAENILSGTGVVKYKAGELVDTITTGNGGFAETGKLYFGKYIVQEAKSPIGFLFDKTQEKVVDILPDQNSGPVVVFDTSFTNTNQKVRLHLNKVMQKDERFDLDGKEIKNVTFGLFAGEKFTALDGKTIEKDDLIQRLTFAQEGENTFEVALPEGKYYVKEIKTGEHYVLNQNMYPFEVAFSEGNQDEYIDVFIQDGKAIVNEIIYKSIEVMKKDRDSGVWVDGAEFAIWRENENDFNRETALDVKVTKGGKVKFDQLIEGSYIIKELSAPEGYLLSEKVIEASTAVNDECVYVDVTNERPKGKIVLKKTGDVLNGFEDGQAVYERQGLHDVTFEVIAQENICDPQGNLLVKQGTKVAELVTDEQGVAESDLLELGVYTIIEAEVPEGFTADSREYTVKLSYADEKTDVVIEELEISNTSIKGSLKLMKVDKENGAALAGAEFTICDQSGEIVYKGITDEQGMWCVENIPYGEYTCTEVKAPEGYLLSDEKYGFMIDEQQEVIEINAENERPKGKIVLKKTGEVLQGFEESEAVYETKGLEGVEFTIVARENISNPQGNVVIEQGTEVEKIVTDEQGLAESGLLELGAYTVIETGAAEGFIPNMSACDVDLLYNGEMNALVVEQLEFVNEPIKGSMILNKKDAKSGDVLGNAEFVVYDAMGEIAYQGITDEQGVWRLEDIPFGTYTCVELKAPDGYLLSNEEFSFTIKENEEKIIINAVNEKKAEKKPIVPIVVPTGDGNNIILWGSLAASMMCITIVLGKKKQRNKKQ